MLLTPEELTGVLEKRTVQLRENLAQIDSDLAESSGHLPRVVVLETECLRAATAAELEWVSGVVVDLKSGALSWDEELPRVAKALLSEAGISAGDLGAD